MSSTVISLQKVSKSFPLVQTAALEHIDAILPSGKIIGLIGPDGAGKTTLIRILSGLISPSSGHVEVLGLNPSKEHKALHSKIGYMPQRFGLYEDLTVIQNLRLYADLQGVRNEEKEDRFTTLLTFSGLLPFTHRLAKDLSGGMKQKLGLSCVLLSRPNLLLLDEPTVGVDPISRRQLWAMVESLVKEGTSILWSTSYLDEAEKCDIAVLLRGGHLLYVGEPKSYTERARGRVFSFAPAKENKRQLLKSLLSNPNVIDVVLQGDKLRVVTKDGAAKAIDAEAKEEAPRFEDAFIASLSEERKRNTAPLLMQNSNHSHTGAVIEAKGLSKRFNHFKAVDNINFTVMKGEIFGLLGPNGAGKSTTFKMLCGLMQPSEGAASVMGLSLQRAPSKARAEIGYMAQKFSLYGDLTARQNLKFFSSIYPVPFFERGKVIDEMISTFELQPILSLSTRDLPLGYKQRLALACSLMHRPKILFLDEPTSGVDPLTRREFWDHINNLVEGGMTVMITTHFMEEAEYCDRIGLINEGRMIMLGSPDDLKKAAQTEKTPSPTLEDAFIYLSGKKEGRADA